MHLHAVTASADRRRHRVHLRPTPRTARSARAETETGQHVDGLSNGGGIRPRDDHDVAGFRSRGVPAGASAAVINVTATDAAAEGYVTVYPCEIATPLASNLNFSVGTTVANATIVRLSANGTVCLFNSEPTNLITDVNGYLI